MTIPLTLFDLFGEAALTQSWPQRVQPVTGLTAPDPAPSFSTWLAAINGSIDVTDVRTGFDGDRAAVEAKLTIRGTTAYAEGLPFVLDSMPDVEFRVLPATATENQVQLFASVSDRGAEVVIERLPVEIRLPSGLIEPHPKPLVVPDNTPTYTTGGDFHPGHLDEQQIRYDRGHPTSIFVHIRVHMTEDGEFDIRPAVPISFGKCLFSGIPCLAVHDFQLIASTMLAPANTHWLRHGIEPWAPSFIGPVDGCFSVRSLHIDPDTPPISDIAHWLNGHRSPQDTSSMTTPPPIAGASDAHAELVVDDLVVPFYSPWVIPVPRHITIGLRRRVLDADDPQQVFNFANAPVNVHLSAGPLTGFIVESLFFKSLPSGLGLTFELAFVFGGSDDGAPRSDAAALAIGLEERYTPTLAYKREFDPGGLPAAGTGVLATINRLLHFEIATVTVDIMTVRLGYSMGRAIEDKGSFGDCALGTVDLFVRMPPTGSGWFKLRSLNGEDVKFIIEGLGWRFGSVHVEGVKLPDGVVILLFDRFGVVIQELGLRAENSATYFSFSGGLLIAIPSGFEGAFLVKRLRFRISGDPGAPPFKVDGFFIMIKTSVVYIECGGFFTETRTPALYVREFGLTGTVSFKMGGKEYTFGLDFLIGHQEATGQDPFDYLFIQAFFRGQIPICMVELRGVRLLFARNMKPLLGPVDRESRELRYYTWYVQNDPLLVPGDRRLAGWTARNDSLAFGLGAAISFSGMGDVVQLSAFILFVYGPDEKVLLIVIEIRLGQNPRAIGYLAVELDFGRGTYKGVLGVRLLLSDFISGAPEWLANIGQLTGTLFIGNDPGTFAIGRLADQRTWLTLHLEWDFFARAFFEAGLCIEIVSGGPKGFGTFIRIEGGIDAGIVQLQYHAGFGFSFEVFATASNDFAVVIWLEAGLRIVLFRFLNFGIRAGADFRLVGSRPTRGELTAEICLETPWFLPDVTWTFELEFGTLAPADLATSTSALRSAGATEGTRQKSAALHVERFDQTYQDGHPTRTWSVNELRAGGPSEAARFAAFAADADMRPVATDATLAVEFTVPVNDNLALSTAVAPNLGDSTSGDLSLTYELVGIGARRRARFGTDRSWHALDEIVELPPDFSDPNGVQLTGSLSAQTISAQWDLDNRIEGRPATKRLLLNASAPFQFTTSDPAADEDLVKDNPQWPCCPPKRTPVGLLHYVRFDQELPGGAVDSRLFSASASRLTFLRDTVARPQRLAATPPGTMVADSVIGLPGVLARMEFDADVAYCAVRLAWSASPGQLALLAFDVDGALVGTRTLPTMPAAGFQVVTIGGTAPIRRIELRVLFGSPGGRVGMEAASHLHGHSAYGQRIVEVEYAAYITLRDFLDAGRQRKACQAGAGGSRSGYEGRGKLFFLPNHEYEITIRTRVTIAHPSASSESAELPEYLHFKTKGLPGLNAVGRIGDEVEQYVQSAYSGGRSLLYRCEPVTLCFVSDFFVAVPLASRPAGGADEHTSLLRMQLLVRPDASVTRGTVQTTTSADWIVENRGSIPDERPLAWRVYESVGATRGTMLRSVDATRERLAVLTQRPEADCPLPDPRNVVGTTLIAMPQGDADPTDPTRALWPGRQQHTATVRMEASPFVDRAPFEAADLSALERLVDNGAGDASSWHITNGHLVCDAGTVRRFAVLGDAEWDHYTATVSVVVSGDAAGVAMGLPTGSTPSQGLFALIEDAGATRRLALYRRTTGTEMIELAHADLPVPPDPAAAVSLEVTAFDDRIRATVGEVSVEAEREEQRAGRLAFVADGAAEFAFLQVAGVPIFAFPFTTSRYRSFREHVLSWPGTLDTLAPDALGPGTTTGTVAGLWTATQADVTAAMQADGTPAARDAVFGRWVRDLGVPLKDEVGRVEISRFVVGGQTACFLLESPEPIDFTTEVTLLLEKRVATSTGTGGVVRPPVLEGLRDWLHAVDRPPPRVPEPDPFPFDIRAALRGAGSDAGARMSGSAGMAAPPPASIVDFSRHDDGVDVELGFAGADVGAAGNDRIVFLERAPGGGEATRFRVYSGRMDITARRGGRVRVRAIETDSIIVLDEERSILGSLAATLREGQLIGIAPGLAIAGGIGIVAGTTYSYEPVAVQVIQDGSGLHALLVPLSGASVPAPLAAGRYRLTLTIDRARWPTTDATDDVNHFHDSAMVTFDL